MVNQTSKSIFTSPSSFAPRSQIFAKDEDNAERKYIRWDSLRNRAASLNATDSSTIDTTESTPVPSLHATLTINTDLPPHLQRGVLFSQPGTYSTICHSANPYTSAFTLTTSDMQSSSSTPQITPFILSQQPSSTSSAASCFTQPRYISPTPHQFGTYTCRFALLPTTATQLALSARSNRSLDQSRIHPLQSPTGLATEYILQVQLLEETEKDLEGNQFASGTGDADWDSESWPWQTVGSLRFEGDNGMADGDECEAQHLGVEQSEHGRGALNDDMAFEPRMASRD